MTKKEKLLIEIRSKVNDVEFETLGLSTADSLNHLQEIAAGLRVHSKPEEETTEEIEETPEAQPEETPEAQPEEKPEAQPEEVKNDFDELLGKIEGAAAPPKPDKKEKPFVERKTRKSKKGASDPEATRIEGFILLIAVDTLFPFSLAFLNNILDKKNPKLTPQQLQLDQKSFDKLEPLADQAADYLSFNINPVAGFFIAASLMYANNLIQLKMEFKNE